jgi:hypothetical protein
MPLLTEFIYRLAFGLALSMALVSPRQVTSGYFRNHLYVLLGLDVLATLIALADRERYAIWPPAAGAVISYLGAVAWLYERATLGRAALFAVAAANFCGSLFSNRSDSGQMNDVILFDGLSAFSGGLLLGSTIAAMFLGHWYLNTPTMEIAPLRRLLKLMAGAVVIRAGVAAIGLVLVVRYAGWESVNVPLLSLRWIAGIVAVAGLVWMSWETLKIPNTQSATGILYVAVIVSFLGELVAHLLSQELPYPV